MGTTLLCNFTQPLSACQLLPWIHDNSFCLLRILQTHCLLSLPLLRKAGWIPHQNHEFCLRVNRNQISWPHSALSYQRYFFLTSIESSRRLGIFQFLQGWDEFHLTWFQIPSRCMLIPASHSGLLDSRKQYGSRNPRNTWQSFNHNTHKKGVGWKNKFAASMYFLKVGKLSFLFKSNQMFEIWYELKH